MHLLNLPEAKNKKKCYTGGFRYYSERAYIVAPFSFTLPNRVVRLVTTSSEQIHFEIETYFNKIKIAVALETSLVGSQPYECDCQFIETRFLKELA